MEGQAVDATRSNFDFKEKVEVNKYYPQFYHKMDKVHMGQALLLALC